MIFDVTATERRVLAAFHRAARDVPAYQTLLAEHGVSPGDIVDLPAFTARGPLLGKHNTFSRFPIDALCAVGALGQLAGVLTSSGHGGRFSFGLISRADLALNTEFTDLALDEAFGVRARRTLAVNCLPMGVVFASNCMTMATTSVREDMAVALVSTFGGHHEQVLLVSDPLFINRVLKEARDKGVDWRRYRMNVVIGEEIFGEHFRTYVSSQLGLDADRPDGGYLLSSFGIGELGLHLGFETPATIAVRRAAMRDAALAQEIFGIDTRQQGLPTLLACHPQRTFVEVTAADAAGYGDLTFSMLDVEAAVPLLRYQPGDIARLMDAEVISRILARRGITLSGPLPAQCIALQGRRRERLPNGSHVAIYKDALYADHRAAARLTGACRLEFAGTAATLHVQLMPGAEGDLALEQTLLAAVPAAARPERLILWPHDRFPFGMALDYERKFTYYAGQADA